MRFVAVVFFAFILISPFSSLHAADGINSVEGSDLPLGASNTEYMRITKDGKIGIGTTSPRKRLEVAGEIAAALDSDPAQYRMIANPYTAMLRNDGQTTSLLMTPPYDPYGSWSELRPLWVDNSTGAVSFGGDINVYGEANINIPACPSGQVMRGIQNGIPLCSKISCRQVHANNNAQVFASLATCGDDEFLTGGGGESEVGFGMNSTGCATTHGFLHTSMPSGNSWATDAYNNQYTGEACSSAVAICCKFVKTN